jgi:hypothetical protein
MGVDLLLLTQTATLCRSAATLEMLVSRSEMTRKGGGGSPSGQGQKSSGGEELHYDGLTEGKAEKF